MVGAWGGKRIVRLGKTLTEAYRTWSERSEIQPEAKTIGQLLDRYLLEVVPGKAPSTQTGNKVFIAELRRAFEKRPLLPFPPQYVYKYYAGRSAKTSALREIEVLSHAYTKAAEWGLIDAHPFKLQTILPGSKPRDRYIEDWEIIECLQLPPTRGIAAVQAYIKVKLLTGMRRSDLLTLKMTQIREDGIHITPHKTEGSTGKKIIYEWSPELRQAVQEATKARPVHISPFLFCNGLGASFWREEKGDAHGWNKKWQGFMRRVMAETKVDARFTEHDIRAKCASDAESLEHARALMAHADSRTTDTIYRRKPERVKPLR